jgi:hypothetical protein
LVRQLFQGFEENVLLAQVIVQPALEAFLAGTCLMPEIML